MMLVRSAVARFTLAIAPALLLLAATVPAGAQTILNEVQPVAAATSAVPVVETFSVTTAGTYTVTLTDLGAALTPSAPLAAVELAVTNSSDALVGSPLVGAGTLTLTSLAAGTYQINVVGIPGNTPGSGPIGLTVNGPGSTQIASFQDILALPSQSLPNGEAVLDSSFTVSSSGNYAVTLTDLQLPQSLMTLTLLLIAQGGASPVATLSAAGTTTVALSAGVTYNIFAVGQANAAANAGLFSAVVTPSGGGAVVFGRAVPVGGTLLVGTPALAAGSDTLKLADLSYPAALTEVGAVLTLNGQSVASLSAAGSQAFSAAAGTYSLFAVGTASTTATVTAGSFAVQVLPASGAALFSAARGVVAAGSTLTPYSFDTTLSAAGAYNALLADFQFPAGLTSVALGVAQNGALLGTPLSAAGQLPFSGAAGAISLLVFAQSTGSGGLFGLEVSPSAGGAATFEVTQGVGAVFTSQQVTITAAGAYSVTGTDLAFPASFANFDTVVTQGTQSVGFIYGGGTFNFTATAGTYSINVLTQTAGALQSGTYSLTIATAPPAPVVTLSVDNTQVSPGGTVDLTWSSQNATGCTASGGWNGTEALSGTATSAPLTSNTTFTLTCTGPGGSTFKSVTVTVSSSAGGGGGGGALDPELLALLATVFLMRRAVARLR